MSPFKVGDKIRVVRRETARKVVRIGTVLDSDRFGLRVKFALGGAVERINPHIHDVEVIV
jgi:hypothetical protein